MKFKEISSSTSDVDFENFISSVKPALRHYILKNLYGDENRQSEADDVLQETFIAFHKSLLKGKSFTNSDETIRFLFGIARHKVSDCRRALYNKHQRNISIDTNDIDVPDLVDPFYSNYYELELLRLVAEIKSKLRKEELKLLELYLFNNLTSLEVAQRMNLSPQNVRQKFHRLINRIKNMYENK
jgi:RNA polymerase sigma factor (sigma-70 family)